MFNLMGTLIKTTFQATVFVTVSVGGFAYLTKPSDESLGKTIAQNAPLGLRSVIKISANTVTDIDDYVFFKTARFTSDTQPSYIGAFNKWFILKK